MTDFSLREVTAFWESKGKPTTGRAWTWMGKPVSSCKKALALTAERAKLGVGPYVHLTFAERTAALQAFAKTLGSWSGHPPVLREQRDRAFQCHLPAL